MRVSPSLPVVVAAVAAYLPLALAAPLTSPPQSFFTSSCNATCGLDLSHQLVDQPTALDRFKLLNTSSNNFVFNFLDNANVPEGPDGKVVLATAGNFPYLIGAGVAMGVGECGNEGPMLRTLINILAM
jgi:hypothetical protein